jgi:isocitrate dehydrogenase
MPSSKLLETGFSENSRQKRVTHDLHRQMEWAVKVKTSEFAAAIVGNMALPAAA